MKQLKLDQFHRRHLSFGGELLRPRTNPKVARPLSSKLPIHLVLRSVKSWMRTPKHFARVNQMVERAAERHGVRIYEFANVGNHLHLLIRIPRRAGWAAFIRELTGRLAMLGRAGWAARPFTRVVSGWRKAYASVKEYVRLNAWEAERGLGKRESQILRELRRIWRMKHPGVAWDPERG